MKNLWIINQTLNTPNDKGNTRHFSLAKYLNKLGWEVSLISGSIEHLTNNQKLQKDQNYKIFKMENLRILLLRITRFSNKSLPSRSIGMIQFFLKLISAKSLSKLPNPDLIIGSSPNPISALAAALISIKYKVPFVFEVRDLWPETLLRMGVLNKNGFFYIILRLIESFLLKISDKVIILFEGGREYYISRGLSPNKLLYIPNGIDMEYKSYREVNRKKDSEPFELYYLGSLGRANSVENIIRAIFYLNKEGLNKKQLILNITGDGPLKKQLINLVIDLKIDNIKFFPPENNKKIYEITQNADGFIFSMLDLPNVYRFGISFNKIFEYMSLSRPIVYWSCAKYDPIQDSGAGIKSISRNPKDLALAIKLLINESFENRKNLSKLAYNYVLTYHSYEKLALNLYNHILRNDS